MEKHERTTMSTKQSVSIDESKRLARSLNQCIPPDGVYAIGRENSDAGKYIVIEKILASGTIKGCTY